MAPVSDHDYHNQQPPARPAQPRCGRGFDDGSPIIDLTSQVEEARTQRQLKAMTAATFLWVLVLVALAALLLFAVPWVVRTVFGWFGIY